MAGQKCPRCEKLTLFKTATGQQCSNCRYTIFVPANGGKGGRGKQCTICHRMTVFNGRCRNPDCQAREK